MRLTFVESRDEFSVYRTSSGQSVYLAHDDEPFTRYKVDLGDIDNLTELYQYMQPMSRPDFVEFLSQILDDPDDADDIVWCACDTIAHRDNGSIVEGDAWACDSCVDNCYYSCSACGILTQDTTHTLNENSVCERCLENNFSWCESCDGYYHSLTEDHSHDEYDGCDCVSPVTVFTLRNDGDPPLANDVETKITLPAGEIDAQGIRRIQNYLFDRDLGPAVNVMPELGNKWQTRDGNYTKRLSRAAYKAYGLKLPSDALSMIGTIAGEHSMAVDFTIKVTRELNGPPEDFYHADSCWWQSYSESRCALKTSGGFALLTYDASGVSGRAWVMPLKLEDTPLPFDNERSQLLPTFETMSPAGFVLFNGYGTLRGYNAARIIAHMAGMTYRKIEFSCGPMYINSGGYLIAPEQIATNYTDGSLYLAADQHSTLFQQEQRAALLKTEEEMTQHVA